MTIKQEIEKVLVEALREEFGDLEDLHFDVYQPREKAYGDFATNIAMVLGKRAGANPMQVADRVVGQIKVPSPLIASVEIKQPGFINLIVSREAYLAKLGEIAEYRDDEDYGRAEIGNLKKIQVEFVSANPTGPLNVVSARAAAVGDALVRLLARTGYFVKSEFYINDSGTQVELLGKSLEARFREVLGERCEIPEGGYPGEYLRAIAKKVFALAVGTDRFMDREQSTGFIHLVEDERGHVDEFLTSQITARAEELEEKRSQFHEYLSFRNSLTARQHALWAPLYICYLSSQNLTSLSIMERLTWIEMFRAYLMGLGFRGSGKPEAGIIRSKSVFLGEAVRGIRFDFARFAVEEIIRGQRASLEGFGNRPEGGLHFDGWFRESSLRDKIDEVSQQLVNDGRFIVEKEGAVWLAGGEGEEDEWVIRRSTGQPTYFLSDISYHIDKRERGFEEVIDIWGPDHHGHVARMQTAMKVASEVMPDIEIPEGWLKVLIAQQVNLIKEGKRVQMSKRAGEYVTLDDVVHEVGADVARFFFLMRRCNSHLDFDLDLAKKTSEENPVYYVQYAHARICSILDFARENGFSEIPPRGADLSLLSSDEEVDLIKHLADFDELVRASALSLEPHRIPSYLIELAGKFHRFYHNHRVVTEECELSEARLNLCCAVRTILRSALSLIGISAPTSM